MAPPKDGASLQGGAAALDERKRVLFHASSLNRSDIISKVVSNNSSAPAVGVSPSSSTSKSGEIDREVLDHVDEGGLTALHHAVKKSSLDAIRVLLRLGVDVTPKGRDSSPFPGLTAYQVALSGRCKGNPEDIKQIFLTEAVQAIAAGEAERLGEFLEAGVDASSKYGVEGGTAGGGGGSMSLADWAEQLGQGGMLSALALPPGNDTNNGTSQLPGDDAGDQVEEELSPGRRRGGGGDHQGEGEGEHAGTGEAGWGGGETPDDVGLFVEGLREAVVNLTAESEELEEELSRRGTLGIIKRARATRQDLILAASEVETANALCDQWRAEEEAAEEENARLQAQVVKAQLAVQRHRAGLDVDYDYYYDESHGSSSSSSSSPTPGEEETRNEAYQQQQEEDDQPTTAGSGKRRPADRTKSSSSRPPPPPSPPPPPEDTRGGSADDNAAVTGGGDGVGGVEAGSDTTEVAVESSRRMEEAEALSSQLQIIAMHLEDELRMMRSLIGGDGAVGVVRRIRALREEIEAAEEEARQTYAVSRYLQARVTVLNDNGDELFSQLDRLHEYLREPPGAALRSRDDPPRAANKEDIDDDDDDQYHHHHHHHGGDVLHQSGEEEEEDENGGGGGGGRGGGAGTPEGVYDTGDRGSGSDDGDDGDDGDEVRKYESRAPLAVTVPASPAALTPPGSSSLQGRGAEAEESGGDEGGLVPPQGAPETSGSDAASSDGRSDAAAVRSSAVHTGDNPVAGEGSTAAAAAAAAVVSATDESDGGKARGGREGRARALLDAPPGGGRAGRGGGGRKVTIAQDVMSVLFGWDVSSAAEKKEARGELMTAESGGGGSRGGSAGVMFA